MTADEQRTHVSLWAMLAAPLLAGNDIRSTSAQTRDILTNRDIIAVDQDGLAAQGHPLTGDRRVMVKPLAGGAVGLSPAACYRVHDLWTHTDSTTMGDLPSGPVAPHAAVVLRVEPRCG
jgi:alpha-galactosidase